MPLVKLLKSIFCRSEPENSTSTSPTADTTKRKLAQPTTPQPLVPRSEAAQASKPAAKRSVFDLVSGGPHGPLCRMIKKTNAASVLEVGVGDGTRAAAVLSTLLKARGEAAIRYIAIDQFELADGPITLKQFNQQIRAVGVKPSLIPLPIEQGLARVAHTFGAVDLVLLADPETGGIDHWLARVSGPQSLVLQFDGQTWHPVERPHQDARRAA
jgi:formylglycine-generating enzyme required for sulfatase activity